MTSEVLKQANELERKIEDLKNHCRQITAVRKDEEDDDDSTPYGDDRAKLHVEPTTSNSTRALRYDLLPISLPEFMAMYLAKAEKEIKRLEKELAKL